jgi:hypothetical protein
VGGADAEKTKRIEVLEKKYRDEKKYREKEHEEAQQEVDEKQKAHLTCLEHYLDLWHLCGGKVMDTPDSRGPWLPRRAGAAGISRPGLKCCALGV